MSMTVKKKVAIAIGFAIVATFVSLAVSGCRGDEQPSATPTTIKPSPTITATTPVPTATPAPLPLGLKIGERFHDVHATKLQLKCDFCHSETTDTYNDPLAQVSNQADRRACLSCHKEGGAQPFYGEEWIKANTGR